MVKFLVTTQSDRIPSDRKILMVDGTVPNWVPKDGDLHFDHHKTGTPVQILDMPGSGWASLGDDLTIITTQVDADACVAAAYHLTHVNLDTYDRLIAIAYDCDHLCVPDEFAHLAGFAAQAVAALKASSDELVQELGLDRDRKNWSELDKENFASTAFERGTMWLVDAINDRRQWPGENGEAKEYWEKVEAHTQMIVKQKRVKVYREALIFDGSGLGGVYIDPRCWLKAARIMGIETQTPITLVRREVFVDSQYKGASYTIGCVPMHPLLKQLDYENNGTFNALTEAEKVKVPNPSSHKNPWGGRTTVGGSGWNSVSDLTPEEVIDIAIAHF